MGTSVGTVSVDLEARIAKLESDLGKAARIAEAQANAIRGSLMKIGATLGVAFSGTAIAHFVGSALEAQDAISKMSQKVGISTETLSGWSLAAQQAGIDVDQLQSGLVKFAKTADAAATGNKEALASFEQVGVKVTDAKGKLKPLDELFSEVADHMAEFADSTGKTALAVKLFGKAGAELIPLLNGGAEGLREYIKLAEDFGLIVGGKTAKAAEDFNDKMEQLSFVSKGVANQIAAALAPTLADLATKAVMFFRSETWKNTLETIAKYAKLVADNVDAIIGAVQRLAYIWAFSFGGSMLKQGTDFVLMLINISKTTDAAGKAVAFFSTSTKAAFSSAVKSVGYLGVALNVVGAAFVGWQIGAYLRDQFLEVRLAGIALIDGLLTAWERLKQGADIAWAAIEYAFNLMVDAIKKDFADMLNSISRGLETIGASDSAAKLASYADNLTSGASAGDKFAKAVDDINKRTDENIKNIHKTTDEMADYEIAAENAKKNTKATTDALDALTKKRDVPLAKDLNAAADAAKKAADAMKALQDLTTDAYAKNLETGNRVVDERAAAIKRIAEAGGKAIEAGNSVVAVQAEVAKAIEQTTEYYAKQQNEAQKSIADYHNAMTKRLDIDRQAAQLQADAVGMTERQVNLQRQIIDAQRDAQDQREKLNEPANKAMLSKEEYDAALKDIQDFEDARVQLAQEADAKLYAQRADYVNGIKKATGDFLNDAANVAGGIGDVVTNSLNNATDALSNFFMTGKLGFKDLLNSILTDLSKFFAKQAVADMLKYFVGDKESGWGGALSGLFHAKGGAYSSPSLHSYANGVYTSPQHFFFAQGGVGTFGEAGAEAIMPLAKNSRGELGVKGSGGGDVYVNTEVNIDNSGATTTDSATNADNGKQFSALLTAKIRQVITDEQRPGGQLWRMSHG